MVFDSRLCINVDVNNFIIITTDWLLADIHHVYITVHVFG